MGHTDNSTVSGWERRPDAPSRETVKKLADVLGVKAFDLMAGVPTGYEDESASQKQQALSGPVIRGEDLGGAAEEAALPMSEAKFRHLGQIRTLTDEEFASIEGELKHLVGRALQSFTPGAATGQRDVPARRRRA